MKVKLVYSRRVTFGRRGTNGDEFVVIKDLIVSSEHFINLLQNIN